MKRVLSFVVLLCLVFTSIGVTAKDEKMINVYTISYTSGTESKIADSTVTGYSEVLETAVTKIRPMREGYEFLGWSYAEKDYENTPLMQPGEKIKISSSVELYAIWNESDMVKISYKDGSQEALPSQLVSIGENRISEIIPQKNGYTFAGWSYSNNEGIETLFPGDILYTEKNVVLLARWERGNLELPMLELREAEVGAVVFECENYDKFDGIMLKIRSLESGFKNTYEFHEGTVKIEDADFGAYEALIVAEKYGIEYVSNKVNFVFSYGIEQEDAPLTVYMDGEKLSFDLPPTLIDGHTFVTLRYFCEYLGADVLWDDPARTAIITYNGTRMKIKENSDVCIVDGTVYRLPAPTVIMSDRMFLPLRSVAELCKCEVIWDPSFRVYMFSDKTNVFDKNVFSISGNNGKFLCVEGSEVCLSEDVLYDAMWIFDTVDEHRGIYEIYNFSDMSLPLEVKISEMKEGNSLRLWQKSGYDGYLWKVTKCGDGEYFIQPANNDEFYLDAANMCITTDVTKVYLNAVYR